jgi:hypothetical protein
MSFAHSRAAWDILIVRVRKFHDEELSASSRRWCMSPSAPWSARKIAGCSPVPGRFPPLAFADPSLLSQSLDLLVEREVQGYVPLFHSLASRASGRRIDCGEKCRVLEWLHKIGYCARCVAPLSHPALVMRRNNETIASAVIVRTRPRDTCCWHRAYRAQRGWQTIDVVMLAGWRLALIGWVLSQHN